MQIRDSFIHIAYLDNQDMVRQGIVNVLQSFGNIKVEQEASCGKELIVKLESLGEMPDICMVDISMSDIDGLSAIKKVKERWPRIKILVLGNQNNFFAMTRMIKMGIDGYISKRAQLKELSRALHILHHGESYYNSEAINAKLVHRMKIEKENKLHITARECELLIYCCSDMSYPQIADKMGISARSVDWHRDSLFKKLNISSRSSLVMYAIKLGLVNVPYGSMSWMLND